MCFLTGEFKKGFLNGQGKETCIYKDTSEGQGRLLEAHENREHQTYFY